MAQAHAGAVEGGHDGLVQVRGAGELAFHQARGQPRLGSNLAQSDPFRAFGDKLPLRCLQDRRPGPVLRVDALHILALLPMARPTGTLVSN